MLVSFGVHESIGRIRLLRPQAGNALTLPMVQELRAAVAGVAESEARVLVLSGEGRSFCVGGDVDALAAGDVDSVVALNEAMLALIADLEALRFPSIAVLHGHALGGGLELALGCTLRAAADDALLGVPEVRLGLFPGSGGTARLPRLVARGTALRMLLTGEPVRGTEALAAGLVDVVAPAAELDEKADELARAVSAGGPLAVSAVLDLVRVAREGTLEEALDAARARLPEVLGSADAGEGLAAFRQKRAPQFVGR